MRLRLLAFAASLLFACAALAQEQAFTNRATELKERGAPDARTLATLPENTAVKVLARGGGWTRVEAGGQSGWLRVFHLRFPAAAETAAPSSSALSGLTSALGFGRPESRTAQVASTGIRGLTNEDIQNASPNPEELKRLESYRVDAAAAERFAREAKLKPVEIDAGEGGKGKS